MRQLALARHALRAVDHCAPRCRSVVRRACASRTGRARQNSQTSAFAMDGGIPEQELHALYQWVRRSARRGANAGSEMRPSARSQVDDIPLSRPKKNIARDFSDGGARAALRSHGCARWLFTLALAACRSACRRDCGALLSAHDRAAQLQVRCPPLVSSGGPTALTRAKPFGRLPSVPERSSAHGRAQKMYNWTTLNQKARLRLRSLPARREL